MMYKQLSDFIEILSVSHPCINRNMQGGDVNLIKSQDINEFGIIDISKLTQVTLLADQKIHWVKAGDLIFRRECHRREHFTASLSYITGRTIASRSLYILRLKENLDEIITPDFICWQLNQKPIQTYLRNTYRGPRTPRVSRKDLADTPIKIISLNKQKQLMRLYRTSLQEKDVLERIIINRSQQVKAIGLHILNNE